MPTTNTTDAVRHYLVSRANYALLLTGKWGSGKTHFFRHKLTPMIKDTPTLGDASVKYEIIELSVFGLASIEEVETKIFVQLLPFLSEGTGNLLAKCAGLFTKAFLTFKTGSDWRITQAGGKVVEESATDIFAWFRSRSKKMAKSLVDFRRFVICVDDIERGIGEKGLDLTTLLGYLNTLVDNGFKLIAIANEDEIKSPQLEVLKEKVIGETLAFTQSLADVLDDVLAAEFPDQVVFQRFLLTQRDLLIELFPEDNLRTLIRFAHKMLPLYSSLTVAEEGALTKQVHLDSALPALVRFSAAIFNEHQRNKLSYLDRSSLDSVVMQLGQHLSLQSPESDSTSKPETVGGSILGKYYHGTKIKYHFFAHTFDYLVSGIAINADELIAELAAVFPIDSKGHLRPEQRALLNLEYEYIMTLDDKQYMQAVQEVLNYVDAGAYLIGDYITLYWKVLAFGNPLSLMREEVTMRLARGMKKSLSHSGPIPNAKQFLSLSGIQQGIDFSFLSRLRCITLHYNEQLIKQKIAGAQARAKELLADDINQLLAFASERAQLPLPLFADLDPEYFARQLLAYIPTFTQVPSLLQFRAAYDHASAENAFWHKVIEYLNTQVPPSGIQRYRVKRLARVLASFYKVAIAETIAEEVQLD
ncbi:hypothetical protein E5K00_08375 [Hymenobacter aquaticus]|uniref:KAP NTPase domain-containing protein n=1 Tax=Hymenobacter aquaticus TaxID=1867101 RepID=A0A4Z0Q542_9BACT|nr:P-loop NTPase fold protein [Hymenobacter aquaticus]TGE25198.1 hypothetical protein E5K00_08375 [Hymenobacter aquaticus]